MSHAAATLTASDLLAARRMGRGFFVLAAVTYVLIVLGALVRAHGAGLACPDWPLCFGEVIPQLDFKVAFEFGHRVLAGSVGIVFLGLAVATLRAPALRSRMAPAMLAAAVLLAVQIVLGGMTVLALLARWTVTSHLITGNAFALALVLIGRRLSALGSERDPARAGSRQAALPAARPVLRAITTLAAVLLLLQIVLGGLVSSSYAGLACPDWPTCMNGEFFPTWSGIQGLHVLHRTTGYCLALVLVAAAGLARRHPGSRPWLTAAAVFVLLQVGVGVTNVLLRIPVELTGLHSALAAGLVCTLGVGVREVWRGPASDGAD